MSAVMKIRVLIRGNKKNLVINAFPLLLFGDMDLLIVFVLSKTALIKLICLLGKNSSINKSKEAK